MDFSEVVLHPVRMRILRCFLGDRRLTTGQLAPRLPDVPVASLYRHVRLLAEHGVLDVVGERQVRGAVERTYALGDASVDLDDAASLSAEQLRTGFLTFVAGLVDDLERYLAEGDVDLVGDRIGFREVGLHLTADEVDALTVELSEVVLRYAGRAPGQGRVERVLATVLLPREDLT